MVINGVTLSNPDVADVAFLERYEAAHDTVAKKAEEITANKNDMRRSAAVRKQCEAIFEFFDHTFGEGTAKAVFGDSVNLTICIKAYEDATIAINKLDAEISRKMKDEALNKFGGNRQQRRSKNKSKNKNRPANHRK